MALSIQKANFWKRISAYLFDTIISLILAAGFATILSAVVGYNKHYDVYQNFYAQYETQYKAEYEEKFGVVFDISQETYNAYTEEEKANFQKAQTEYAKAISQAMQNNVGAVAAYEKVLSFSFMILSLSLLLGIGLVQLLPALLFHNGQTLGKKIFGIAVMRSSCVQLSNPVLFIRVIFGLYTIETIFPVALLLLVYFGIMGGVGTITAGMLLLLQCGVLIGTRNHSSIHDLLSDTVVVDMASQRIFKTENEMLEVLKAEQAEEAAKKDYI